jgi:universal stress protein A
MKKMNGTIKNILVPIDMSNTSKVLAHYASVFANRFGAKVHVLHVFQEYEGITKMILTNKVLENLMDELHDSGKKEIEDFCKKHFDRSLDYELSFANGSPFKEILDAVKVKDIDMVIMGTHGKTRIDHFFVGKTADRVVRRSNCPVMTVRVTSW